MFSIRRLSGLPRENRRVTPALAVLISSALLSYFAAAALAQSTVPPSHHVILVIEENRSYSTVTNSGNSTDFMPWLIGEGNTYGHATNYTTDSGGSLLDYLWLSSGSCHTDNTTCAPSTLPSNTTNFGCTGGGCPSVGVITDDNIFRELISKGMSFKIYLESLPSVGYTGGDINNYATRHNPGLYYSDVGGNSTFKNKMVPFTQFATDLANNVLPEYSIIVPNLQDDAHDGSPQAADNWLQANVAPVLNQSYFQAGGDGLLIITFDNGDNDNPGQVYTAVIGPSVVKGFVSNQAYKHENTLRTIVDALQITTYPGASGSALPMVDFFSGTTNGGSVTITSPADGSTSTSQSVLISASATEPNASIDHLEVWDNGTKLGNSPPGSTINQTFTLPLGTNQITVQDMSTGTFQVLHKAIVTINVTTGQGGGGVTVNSPVNGSTVGTQVLVDASATESNATIDHLEVWDNGTKLGNSPPGSTIHQTFTLAVGSHQMTVQDMSTVTFQVLHKTIVNFTVANDGVTINSPVNGSNIGTSVLVDATAIESSATVDHLEVFDNGNDLGSSPPGSTIHQTFTLATGSHQMTVKDIASGSLQVLHSATVNFTVSPDGVTVTTPVNGSTSGTQVRVTASAAESSASIDHLEVWDNGTKLGNSPSGSTINQTFNLAAGSHQMTVQDMSTGTFQVLHKTIVNFTVSAASGVTILAPANNSTTSGSSVVVNAFANSSTSIDHLEIWADGNKLGNSFATEADTAFNFSSGQHTITVQSMSSGTFQVLNKSQVTITVP